MDLAYLRSHPQQLPAFLTHQRIRETPVRGGSICTARRLTLDDGSSVFAKSLPEGSAVPPGFFEAEARGLRWLREADAVPVPEVIAELPELLALEWVEPRTPRWSVACSPESGRTAEPSHPPGCTATCGPATSCGEPRSARTAACEDRSRKPATPPAGPGSWTPPPTAATGKPTSRCWHSLEARRTWM